MSRSRATAGPALESLPKRFDSLLVLDVDEVVLHFIDPFRTLLSELGARLQFSSFALHGNVRSISTGAAITGHDISAMTERLYEEQEERQAVVEGVTEALEHLSGVADILFLTAMTPKHHAIRRRLLDREGLHYPMIATERSKGAILAELSERWTGPVVFVDDLPQNLEGARRSLPDVVLVHMMADGELRPHLPALPKGAHAAGSWAEAVALLPPLLSPGRGRAELG